ncbi:MAG: DNA polymerase IV [Polyangiaceae bacterium]
MSARVILHADMDAFYASIEQRDHPELRGKPVIVGATHPRSVVSAASYEARVFGVRSAMPGFRARELCPQGVFLPGDMAKYARVSAQVHEVFEHFTPQIEPLALDEAFLDVTGSVALFGDALTLAREVKRRVREATQLVVSVGVAPNKHVAKIACTLGKPDGLLLIPAEVVRDFVTPLPIRRMFGVGPVLGRALQAAGLLTFGDVARAEPALLARIAGNRAEALRALARGDDPRDVVADRAAKSYGEENTFAQDVLERDVVSAALTAHAEAVARRLRRDGCKGRTVTLKAKMGKRRGARRSRIAEQGEEPVYPLVTRQRALGAPTDDAALIRSVALALWDELALKEPIRLLGVSVSSIVEGSAEQLELFAPARPSDKLGPALDAIEERFGRGVIRRGVQAPEKVTPSMQKKRGE